MISEAFTALGKNDAGPLVFCKSLNISECDEIDEQLSSEGINQSSAHSNSPTTSSKGCPSRTGPRKTVLSTFRAHLKLSSLFTGITVNAYNPSSQKVRSFVRVPVSDAVLTFDVVGSKGENMVHDVLPIPKSVLNLPER